jgi:hypothetical protein
VLEALVENVLNDFTKNVGNSLLNLIIDSSLNIDFGVINNNLSVIMFVREDSAVTVLVDIEEVLSANRVAFACINVMITFDFQGLSFAGTVVSET